MLDFSEIRKIDGAVADALLRNWKDNSIILNSLLLKTLFPKQSCIQWEPL